MRARTVRSPCCVTLAQRNVHGWEPESHAADQRHIELWAAKIRCPAAPSAQKCQKPLGPQYLIRSPERKYFLVKDLLPKNPLFPCDDKTKRLATTQDWVCLNNMDRFLTITLYHRGISSATKKEVCNRWQVPTEPRCQRQRVCLGLRKAAEGVWKTLTCLEQPAQIYLQELLRLEGKRLSL